MPVDVDVFMTCTEWQAIPLVQMSAPCAKANVQSASNNRKSTAPVGCLKFRKQISNIIALKPLANTTEFTVAEYQNKK